ncbi:MAG TPA: B-box zinc finger protein [Leptolinea sp.]
MTNPQPATLYCANHPGRETLLRCNRCEKPICVECAILTPTGYRCKECVRSQQKIFDTAQPQDYIFAVLISGSLSFIGSLLVGFVGFFSILLAPAVGWVIAEAVRKATKRHRSKPLFRLAAAATALGAIIRLLPVLLIILIDGAGFGNILSIVWPVVYAFIVCTTVYTRLSGIQIK